MPKVTARILKPPILGCQIDLFAVCSPPFTTIWTLKPSREDWIITASLEGSGAPAIEARLPRAEGW